MLNKEDFVIVKFVEDDSVSIPESSLNHLLDNYYKDFNMAVKYYLENGLHATNIFTERVYAHRITLSLIGYKFTYKENDELTPYDVYKNIINDKKEKAAI